MEIRLTRSPSMNSVSGFLLYLSIYSKNMRRCRNLGNLYVLLLSCASLALLIINYWAEQPEIVCYGVFVKVCYRQVEGWYVSYKAVHHTFPTHINCINS